MAANPADAIARGHAYVSTDPKDRVLGVAIFYPLDGAMYLETVAVHPHASGRGLGRTLIAHCEARAQADGLTGVTLYTNAAMTSNLALYPRLGYREVGRRTESGFDRVFFEKRMPLS
ncbi:GNAT family N-acetyltransferase [Palleronia abyssalis]|uniref:Mycothiol acetyltransferase n=1 Tax=Palleronia abyssalis TaxID=1501240 RepID=A0A2R8BRU0_9RHOB|nr:GNAT family N-acetyltransferase [Palleronia abyssalis]SPJ22858.1 Mycothiol acetyltransferase [Palleronia abyssalis]